MQALIKAIQWVVIILLFIFWTAEDEDIHLEASIREGDFMMEWVLSDSTCQVNAAHVHRETFRCDGCKRFACGECGEFFLATDEWLCELCLLPKEPIILLEAEVPF